MAKLPNKHGGGAKTNVNGLKFEQTTSLNEAFKKAGFTVNTDYTVSLNGKKVGISINKAKLSTVFLRSKGVEYSTHNSKRWDPDEAFINDSTMTVYIIEKKFQNGAGSVDEKLATFPFKKIEYEKLFTPLGYTVKYMYLLSSIWFDTPKYKDYYDYMDSLGCEHYFDELPLSAIGL